MSDPMSLADAFTIGAILGMVVGCLMTVIIGVTTFRKALREAHKK